MKSPALSEIMKPLCQLDAKAREEFDAESKRYEIERAVAKVERSENPKAAKSETAKPSCSIRPACSEPTPATARRQPVNDSTVEKLGEILNANPRGILLFRDELTGWLRTLDREKRGDRALSTSKRGMGSGSFTYDRIGRGTVHIPAACVSILGGIQPGPLGDYLRACVSKGGSATTDSCRGSNSSFISPSTAWRNVDPRPDIRRGTGRGEIVGRRGSPIPSVSGRAGRDSFPSVRR